MSVYDKASRDARKAMGRCVKCGKKREDQSKTYCLACLVNKRSQRRGLYAARKRDVVCTRCGGPLDGGSRALCQKHLDEVLAYKARMKEQKRRTEKNG